MFLRKQGFLTTAFEQTYQRSIAEATPKSKAPLYYSMLSGFLGWQYKYTPDRHGEDSHFVNRMKDRNIYNWIEQIVFAPARIAKNTAKLVTEFMWNAAVAGLIQASDTLHDHAKEKYVASKQGYGNVALYFARHAAAYALKGLSLAPWLVAKIGQSITSPITAMKETSAYVAEKTGYKVLGVIAAGLRFMLTAAAYATIATFALPAIAPALGSQVAGAFASAVNFIGNLPVISTIGSYFAAGLSTVASFMGVSMSTAAVASAAAVAGATLVATPVLTGLKAGLRALSPFKQPAPAPYAASKNQHSSASIQSSMMEQAQAQAQDQDQDQDQDAEEEMLMSHNASPAEMSFSDSAPVEKKSRFSGLSNRFNSAKSSLASCPSTLMSSASKCPKSSKKKVELEMVEAPRAVSQVRAQRS